MTTPNYVIIENTRGYMPEDDDPPTFDSYAEALNYLVDYNKKLSEEDDGDGPLYEVSAIENGWFEYSTHPIGPHTLPRYVQIEVYE